MTFNTDASLAITADCNNAAGFYQGEGGNLSVEIGPVAMAGCSTESLSNKFIDLLARAVSYHFEGENLIVEVPGETSSTTMVLAPAETPAAAVEQAPDAVAPDELADVVANLSYPGIFPTQPITLTNGIFDYEDGNTGRSFVRLYDRLIARGDVDGDGVEDAVVLLEDNTSGTGRFVYAVAVLDALGRPTPTPALMLGDRIQVKSLSLAGDQIVAEFIGQGPGDGQCCATWNMRTVLWQDGGLVEGSNDILNQVALSDLDGTSWRLVDFNGGQDPALPEPVMTLQIGDGQVSGFAGCNDYAAPVTGQEDVAQSFIVGPITTTEQLCPELAANQEASYLARLGRAVAWWYDAGYLAITYVSDDNRFTHMLFEPVAAAGTPAAAKPEVVTALEAAYGVPSQAGFGSAVFFDQLKPTDTLADAALAKYKFFVGDLWERYGEDAWMGPWKEVYARQPGGKPDIVAELRGIADRDARQSVPMILDNIDDAEQARSALSAAFDDPALKELAVYNLGDGEAMSGILVAGRNTDGVATFLVFLLD